jgi:phage tail-like protein
MVDLSLGRQQAIKADDRSSTLTSATFVIESGGQKAMFSELGGISSEVEQAEYMEAGPRGPQFGRFIGRAKPPTVTLKRSMTKGGSSTRWIWLWHATARKMSSEAYRDCTLQLFGAGSTDPARTYHLTNAIPTKVEIAGMKAGGTEVVLQTLTLMCDAIEEG